MLLPSLGKIVNGSPFGADIWGSRNRISSYHERRGNASGGRSRTGKKELFSLWDQINQPRMLETWHDAQQIREEALIYLVWACSIWKHVHQIERLFWSITKEIHQMTGELKHIPEELLYLPKLLSDKYFCNFSLFQSLPDSWAIDQIFPIIPIQRLDENQTARLHFRI